MRWLVLLALAIVGCMADDEMPCTIHHGGRYYDLNPLKASKDYEFQTPGNHLFVMNVCRTPVRETFGLKDVKVTEIGGFIRRDHGDFSIGSKYNPVVPRLQSSPDSRGWVSLQIQIRREPDTGTPRLIAQLPPGDDEEACAFFLEWRTHVACPTNDPGSALGFFSFTILLQVAIFYCADPSSAALTHHNRIISLAILYLVAGTLYNRFVLRLRGVDQIPKFSVEAMKYHASEALDWIKDLAGSAQRPGSGYARMPNELGTPFSGGTFSGSSQPSGGINPVSHQTQVSSGPGSTLHSDDVGHGFVRPHPSRAPSGPPRRAEINPVSHQAQIATSQVGNVGPTPPAPITSALAPAENTRPQPSELHNTAQKREFMLGDDEDEEDDLVNTPPTATSRATAPTLVASSPSSDDSAVLRGRDLGSEDVTRL
ncbi:hypothetical protein H0H81_009459 [Sphagnurus paluster]|uniref:Autophagy-related protein 27 n=1 Tax=Sphagnurus paluster TaxID=117069 RepID=A0A9P7GIF5_9AGAR|nr:hypothetical protein H0H81_009459 [Sphagnurus paluster]